MKITFVLDTFGGGGKERRCLQLLQGLNKQGYTDIQIIIVNNDVAYEELYLVDAQLHIIDRKKRGLNILQTFIILYYLLRKFNSDIVQVWGVFSTFFINPIRCIMRFKYIGSYVANCNKPKKFSIENFNIRLNSLLSNYVIGNSEAGIKAYSIPRRKAKVIYNGFNEERYINNDFNKVKFKEDIGVSSTYVVSMIARLDANKDQETFILAAKEIIRKRKDVTFLIIGGGPNLEYLQTLITEFESLYIYFLGFRSDVENILSITDVSVLCTNPSKHKEGVSNAIMESFAFGVPVIATNDGGTPEIVETDVNGFLIEEHNSQILSERICEILNNEKLKIKLSHAAKSTIKTKFSLNNMTTQYVDMYNLLLDK
ncbi:glycosyltransferase [uncultured Maribacter sp.]|uniref:glycosyltransferase n=1 Tax=uncultured Maribacter sp. TaxID=431308 RepID=UPI00262C167A|nr:glycosyltransferase [uncultured Maribacter sp.]